MNKNIIEAAVRASLDEDVGSGDITAELIPKDRRATATIISHEPAVLCGIPWAEMVYRCIDPSVSIAWKARDGDTIEAKQIIATVTGPARALVTGERSAVNWLQTLSGTATQVKRYLNQLTSENVRLLDTRKTIPGLRYAQKYAVRCAGGVNHRMGLYDAFLIKENHIMACGSIKKAIQQARIHHPDKSVEIEVENLDELQQALDARADIILLDNFELSSLSEAVRITAGHAKLEVSGGVSLENIAAIAKTGVDYISVGSLTKHIHAIDMAMRIDG